MSDGPQAATGSIQTYSLYLQVDGFSHSLMFPKTFGTAGTRWYGDGRSLVGKSRDGKRDITGERYTGTFW